MKRAFYALVLVVAVILIFLGIKASSGDNNAIENSLKTDGVDQLWPDAGEKTPATN